MDTFTIFGSCLVMLAVVTPVVVTHTVSTFVYLHSRTVLCTLCGHIPYCTCQGKILYLSVWFLKKKVRNYNDRALKIGFRTQFFVSM